MSKVSGLKYIGRMMTPDKGPQPFWDSGVVVSPVDFAMMRGFQTAVFNAPNSRERSKASKKLRVWMGEFNLRSGVWAANAFIVIDDEGRILLTAPEYEDEWPGRSLDDQRRSG